MSSIRFPIETGRLVIRPLVIGDAVALHELYSDPEAMKHLTSDLPSTVAESEAWVQAKIDLHNATGLSLWAVVQRASGEVIGDAGLQVLDDGATVEIGARLKRKHWGSGLAAEAAVAIMEAGFTDLGLTRIVGITAPGNDRAIAAMERCGMRYVGIERHFDRDWVTYERTP